jgi:hypothetical protein
MESSGNGSTGGVTAFPANLSDPNLTVWVRSGPTVFVGCDGSAGPSPIIVNPVTQTPQLIAIHGHGEALFEATSPSLTEWAMVDATFLPERGGGGGLWHPLPPVVQGQQGSSGSSRTTAAGAPWPTHIMQLDGSMGDGAPTFSLMEVDAGSSSVRKLTAPVPVDLGLDVR